MLHNSYVTNVVKIKVKVVKNKKSNIHNISLH